jgi:hypothetical protein
MITSGAVSRLTEYLQGKDLSDSTQQQEQLLCRLRNFTSVALAAHDQQQDGSNGSNTDAAAAGGGAAAAAVAAASSVPLTALVRKLQGALASSEAFPVLCSRLVPSSGALGGSGRSLSRSAGMSGSFNRSTLSSGLHALTQPFKLRLVRHDQVRANSNCSCYVGGTQAGVMHHHPSPLHTTCWLCVWCMHSTQRTGPRVCFSLVNPALDVWISLPCRPPVPVVPAGVCCEGVPQQHCPD